MTATIAAEAGALLGRLAEDETVRAVLLLHGLHPETVEMRVRRALEDLRPRIAASGLDLRLVESNSTRAHVCVRWTDEGPGIDEGPARIDTAALRGEIEAAVVEAAPDLETLEIERLIRLWPGSPMVAVASAHNRVAHNWVRQLQRIRVPLGGTL